jgi:hypothetical protein
MFVEITTQQKSQLSYVTTFNTNNIFTVSYCMMVIWWLVSDENVMQGAVYKYITLEGKFGVL